MNYDLFSHSPQAPCFNGKNEYYASNKKDKLKAESLIGTGESIIVKLKSGNSYSYWEGKPIKVETLHKDDVPTEHYSYSTKYGLFPCKHKITLESSLVQIQ